MIGESCLSVSSFGSLKHFRKDQQPAGASDRCLTCQVENDCPYSARRLYLTMIENGYTAWPVDVLAVNPSVSSIQEALENGPYGRCVYTCDNDVVDNQVVNMLFRSGKTASFTMTAFTEMTHRKTRLFGTRGELFGDGVDIEHFDFLTNEKKRIPTVSSDASIMGGHGGGDYGLMDHFTKAVAERNPDWILSGADDSLETHRMVFAAEISRKDHKIVDL
jgi:hypothetical protein